MDPFIFILGVLFLIFVVSLCVGFVIGSIQVLVEIYVEFFRGKS